MHLNLSFMSLQKDGESVMFPPGHYSTGRMNWSLKQGRKDWAGCVSQSVSLPLFRTDFRSFNLNSSHFELLGDPVLSH